MEQQRIKELEKQVAELEYQLFDAQAELKKVLEKNKEIGELLNEERKRKTEINRQALVEAQAEKDEKYQQLKDRHEKLKKEYKALRHVVKVVVKQWD